MSIKTRRIYVVMEPYDYCKKCASRIADDVKDVLNKTSKLPDELKRLVFLYIPNRLPFKDELIDKMKREWYECSQYSFHFDVLKKMSIPFLYHKNIDFPITNYTFVLYKRLKYVFIKDLKAIAQINKIKGRSELKTHNDFISTFLKNDVYIPNI